MNRKIIVMVMLTITIITTANAQSVVGKWQCTKEFIESLGLGYWNLEGYCKFKKNGTFKAKLHRKQVVKRKNNKTGKIERKFNTRAISISIAGAYDVKEGQMSTTVTEKGISCYVEPDEYATKENPYIDERSEEMWNMRAQSRREIAYDNAINMADRISNEIKKNILQGLNVQQQPIMITESAVAIGEKTYFSKCH